MFRVWGWSAWAVVPILGLAFHYGAGQSLLKRDLAIDQLQVARGAEADAAKLQEIAYAAQFKTLTARQQLLRQDTQTNRQELDQLFEAEQKAYAAASDAWKAAADRYQEVETLLEGTPEANQIRWLRGRALVRAGEVFNGIEELKATLAEAVQSGASSDNAEELVLAAREELAAAHYYGARLLREEGRAADIWRQVSETSRQQFRYLAERTAKEESANVSSNLQRNLERVLDLEQQDRTELVGRPIPKDSPRARRPGDGEPSKRPGIGPPQGDRPGNGASGMMEIGDGW
jgi:hypothetical protein